MAGKASFWLDAPAPAASPGTGVPGKVVGAGENGTIRVEVGESGNVVNVPSGGGVFAAGSDVRVQVDAQGAPSGVLDVGPSTAEGGLVYAGAEGRHVREVGEVARAAQGEAARAMRELEEARNQTVRELAVLRTDLSSAQLVTDRARNMFIRSEQPPPQRYSSTDLPPMGAVYEVLNSDGSVNRHLRWDGSRWLPFKVVAHDVVASAQMWTDLLSVAGNATIGGNLIAGGSVTADKIVASKELSAKVARFDETVVSKLRAENAVISGDLIAENLTGKTITGSTVRAMGTSSAVEMGAHPARGPYVEFSSGIWPGTSRIDSVVSLTPTGVKGEFRGSAGKDFSVSWEQLVAAPYYRMTSGEVNMPIPKKGVLRAPLKPDTSARGSQIRVMDGDSLLVPKAGRYRVTGWACVRSETWDTLTEVALLRGDAKDADWGDLYGYAIGPGGEYATPQFTGLVDIKTSERMTLGIKTNGTSRVRDYRFELEFVCPL